MSCLSKCSVHLGGTDEPEGWTDEGFCHTLGQRDALEAQLFNSVGGSECTVRNSAEATFAVPSLKEGCWASCVYGQSPDSAATLSSELADL